MGLISTTTKGINVEIIDEPIISAMWAQGDQLLVITSGDGSKTFFVVDHVSSLAIARDVLVRFFGLVGEQTAIVATR